MCQGSNYYYPDRGMDLNVNQQFINNNLKKCPNTLKAEILSTPLPLWEG
jgi:hypothetical protein